MSSSVTNKCSDLIFPTELIQPFSEAVALVFRKVLNLEVWLSVQPVDDRRRAEVDVTGLIGFTGELAGSIAIGFSNKTAKMLVERFAGCAADPHSADFADAIGELTNLIAGCAKSKLDMSASISVPTVVFGNQFAVAPGRGIQSAAILGSTSLGTFTVELFLRRT